MKILGKPTNSQYFKHLYCLYNVIFSCVFSLASLLCIFFSFLSPLCFQWGGLKRTQWAHELGVLGGREAFRALAGTLGSGLCLLSQPFHVAAAGQSMWLESASEAR